MFDEKCQGALKISYFKKNLKKLSNFNKIK